MSPEHRTLSLLFRFGKYNWLRGGTLFLIARKVKGGRQGMMYVNYLRKVVVGGMQGIWCPGAWRAHGGHGGACQQCQQCHRIWTDRVTHWPPDQWPGGFFAIIHTTDQESRRELIALNFNQPVAALYQVLALVGLWGPSCGAPNYWPISPAQFETNHPQPRWAAGKPWRMDGNTNSEIQFQYWYNQGKD